MCRYSFHTAQARRLAGIIHSGAATDLSSVYVYDASVCLYGFCAYRAATDLSSVYIYEGTYLADLPDNRRERSEFLITVGFEFSKSFDVFGGDIFLIQESLDLVDPQRA